MNEGKAKITNPRAKASLTLPYERADTLFSRARGLMFRQKPLAILFTFDFAAAHSIHSLFVPFEFDAVYLDEKMRVTEIFSCVKPFIPLLTPAIPAKFLLELPAKDALRLKLNSGDIIQIYEV